MLDSFVVADLYERTIVKQVSICGGFNCVCAIGNSEYAVVQLSITLSLLWCSCLELWVCCSATVGLMWGNG
jgi:hypothetical protein